MLYLSFECLLSYFFIGYFLVIFTFKTQLQIILKHRSSFGNYIMCLFCAESPKLSSCLKVKVKNYSVASRACVFGFIVFFFKLLYSLLINF